MFNHVIQISRSYGVPLELSGVDQHIIEINFNHILDSSHVHEFLWGYAEPLSEEHGIPIYEFVLSTSIVLHFLITRLNVAASNGARLLGQCT